MANKTDLVPIKFYDISYVPRMNDKGREALCHFPPSFRRMWDPGALLSFSHQQMPGKTHVMHPCVLQEAQPGWPQGHHDS